MVGVGGVWPSGLARSQSVAPTDVIALADAALQAKALPYQVQSVGLARDGDESWQKADLAVTLCPRMDWRERWRPVPDGDGVYLVIEVWVAGNDEVEEAGAREGSQEPFLGGRWLLIAIGSDTRSSVAR